jgi:hypothetical protein
LGGVLGGDGTTRKQLDSLAMDKEIRKIVRAYLKSNIYAVDNTTRQLGASAGLKQSTKDFPPLKLMKKNVENYF